MAASRVETEPKPRWLEPKYKPDLKKYPEEVTKLCPIVITTIAAAPMRGGHDDFEFDRTHKLAATDDKLWNDTKTGLLGIYKASGHMYQTEDKALDYYLDQMKANCDTP